MLIRTPLTYMGNKYKLLPQLLPLFPKNIGTFYDLFCGGLTVSLNAKAERFVCNDTSHPIMEIYRAIQKVGAREAVVECRRIMKEFGLDNKDESKYIALRDFYNSNRNPMQRLVLCKHSFNCMCRFNNDWGFNMSFGMRTMGDRDVEGIMAIGALSTKAVFTSADFQEVEIDGGQDAFVYLDPPYLASFASYSKYWGEAQEHRLLGYMDSLNGRGIKFGLSNALSNNGKENGLLKEWLSERPWAIAHEVGADYRNCNYQRMAGAGTKEVYVCNYKAMAVKPKKF